MSDVHHYLENHADPDFLFKTYEKGLRDFVQALFVCRFLLAG